MRKKEGGKGIILLKIDLEKVYIRLSWNFIRNTLEDVKFNKHWLETLWDV